MDTANRRILLLKMINENKEYLFGHPLSPKWSKAEAWEQVAQYAKDLKLISGDRDWKYLRDTTWQNWRKRAVGKYYRVSLATAIGEVKRFEEYDKLILEIIGKQDLITQMKNVPEINSIDDNEWQLKIIKTEPGADDDNRLENKEDENEDDRVKRIEVQPSLIDNMNYAHEVDREQPNAEDLNVEMDIVSNATEFVITTECDRSPTIERPDVIFNANDNWNHNGDWAHNYGQKRSLPSAANNFNSKQSKFGENELIVLRKEKIEIKTKLCVEQLKIAERQRYKLDLELLKLEQELGLPPSKFTKKFFAS